MLFPTNSSLCISGNKINLLNPSGSGCIPTNAANSTPSKSMGGRAVLQISPSSPVYTRVPTPFCSPVQTGAPTSNNSYHVTSNSFQTINLGTPIIATPNAAYKSCVGNQPVNTYSHGKDFFSTTATTVINETNGNSQSSVLSTPANASSNASMQFVFFGTPQTPIKRIY